MPRFTTAPPFPTIQTVEALEALFARSHQATVLLLLDAPDCPIGLAAREEMARLDVPAGVECAAVDVASGRGLTRLVEAWTGVRHESPQVLLLRGQRAVWHGSHFDVTAEAVRLALDSAV